jgi:hypothetical protein
MPFGRSEVIRTPDLLLPKNKYDFLTISNTTYSVICFGCIHKYTMENSIISSKCGVICGQKQYSISKLIFKRIKKSLVKMFIYTRSLALSLT